MSVRSEEREGPADTIAGFLATLALVAGVFSMVYRPARIGPAALVVALIAVAIGGRHERLAMWAVAVVSVGWVIGMIVSVLTESPVY